MEKRFGIIFGGIIAYILLLLYAGTVGYMILEILDCAQDAACTAPTFNDGISLVVTTIGGLISALVISKLTVTTPGENPGALRLAESASGTTNKVIATLVLLYIGVWLVVGLTALIVGVLIYPDLSDTLSDLGTTWLGLAVASGYAYFNVDPA